MKRNRIRILIVGAGPTGLTAGVELVRRGIKAQIIDRRDGGSTLSRAVGINPRSLEILTPSGVTTKLLAKGIKYNSLRIYREDKLWTNLLLTAAAPLQHGHNYMLGLPQDETEAILRDTFVSLGGVVNYDTELTGIAQNDDEVIAQTTKGQLSCEYLIGADGTKSATRDAVGIEYHGHELPDIWSIADVDVDNWSNLDSATLCLMRNGKMAAILPLGEKRFRLVSNTDSALTAQPLDINVTNVRREGQFKIILYQVKDYSKGRVFLAGDSAHSQSPVGGRGMNLGIADAADLAARFATGDLLTYSRDRYKEGKRVMAGAEQMRKIVTSGNTLVRALTLAGIKTISYFPILQRKFASNFLYG
jgi:2-polyprenyl-6-methoxyphenol hydroxylase-like FAD-dependent oxidoreductase